MGRKKYGATSNGCCCDCGCPCCTPCNCSCSSCAQKKYSQRTRKDITCCCCCSISRCCACCCQRPCGMHNELATLVKGGELNFNGTVTVISDGAPNGIGASRQEPPLADINRETHPPGGATPMPQSAYYGSGYGRAFPILPMPRGQFGTRGIPQQEFPLPPCNPMEQGYSNLNYHGKTKDFHGYSRLTEDPTSFIVTSVFPKYPY